MRLTYQNTEPEVSALGFFVSAIRSGLLGRDVPHDTLKPYTRRALNQIEVTQQ